MALPVTLTNAEADAFRNSYVGPFKSSGGAFYTMAKDGGDGNAHWNCWKATDPTDSFTIQDTANNPSTEDSGAVYSLNIFQDGDILDSVTQSLGGDVTFAQFDMSSDAWVDLGTSDYDILIDGTAAGTALACDIAVLSAAYGVGSAFVKIRVVYQGAIDMDMGGDFERIDENNSVDDGVNWSGPTQIDNGGTVPGLHYTGPRIVLPPNNSDQCHIFFSDGDGATPGLIQRAIAGDDTVRAYRDTGLGMTVATYPFTHGIGFMRSSTSKVRIGYHVSNRTLRAVEFDAFSDDTDITSSRTFSNIGTDEIQTDNSSINACLAVDGSTIRGLYVDDTDDDLFPFDDGDSDTYTVGDEHLAGTVNHISCNVYDRSGTKLAMIYDDAGTVYYDEIAIGVAAANPKGPLGHPFHGPFGGPV